MSPEELADAWYLGNTSVEDKLFKDTPPYEPNELASEVYRIIKERNSVQAEKFYKRIFSPFD